MNGNVVFSNDAPPPSLANATSSTATRPSIFDAGGSTRGVRNANRGDVAEGDDGMAAKTTRLSSPRPRRLWAERSAAATFISREMALFNEWSRAHLQGWWANAIGSLS